VHYYKVVHFGISLPSDEEEVGQDTANKVPADRRVYFLPDVMIDEAALLIGFTAFMVLLTAFFFTAPLESIANPQSTPLHTVAPWYFYWLQGLLKIADKTIAGVYVPGILLVLLMAIPYLDRNPSRRGRDRRVAIVSGVVAGIVMIILSWMGTPYYAVQGSPAVEVVQELMPEETMGPLREIGYDGLPLGVYDTRALPESTGSEHFDHVLHEFEASIKHFEEIDPSFNEAYGILTISQEQPQLKRFTWDIYWLSPDGKEESFNRIFFLHQNSFYWEQYGWKNLPGQSAGGHGAAAPAQAPATAPAETAAGQ
jgi:hypothetical protein